MAGPLPNPERRRRNAPTIPTTKLPASGRKGAAPRAPKWVTFGEAGSAWWRWAWRTPQAAAWSSGDVPVVARRACLEDDVATLSAGPALDLLAAEPELKQTIRTLAGLATGRLTVFREMRELDDRLGLTPKGLAALRWVIVDDRQAAPAPTPEDVPRLDERRRRLTSAS